MEYLYDASSIVRTLELVQKSEAKLQLIIPKIEHVMLLICSTFIATRHLHITGVHDGKFAVHITERSDNRISDNRGSTVLLTAWNILVCIF